MVVPFDFVLDDELWAYLPVGVRLHVTRVPAGKGLIDAGRRASRACSRVSAALCPGVHP